MILTLLQLKRRLHSAEFVFSTALSLKFGNDKKCEVDLAVLQAGRGGDIELGFGECKDEGGVIDDQDIDNLKAVLDAFSKVRRINSFLIFAKTADSFTPNEIVLFKQLKADHILPILLTNQELEPYDPYENVRNANLPFPYALSLKEMAANSDHIYLR